MESLHNLKKQIKNIDSVIAIDMGADFAIIELIKHTAFSACRDGSFFV